MNNNAFYKNSVLSDIYIGKGAGKKLLNDIQSARKSVKVVSPFLSPEYIKLLIDLKLRNIDVQLITMDEIEDFNKPHEEKLIFKLIKQIKITDDKANLRRKKISLINKFLLFSWITIYLTSIIAGYIFHPKYYWGLIIALIIFIIFLSIRSVIAKKVIFSYSYQPLFPFRVIISPQNQRYRYQSQFYIHSKVFIIDDSIAYLGSLNFSKSGLEYNFESRIRLTEPETISGLNKVFDDIFNDENIYSVSIESMAKRIYKEPIN